MYKLGFCIYGPACRFKHTRQGGPPPDPELIEACKPKELRNINIVANQANEGILPADQRRRPLRLGMGEQGQPGGMQLALAGQQGGGRPGSVQGGGQGQGPSYVDNSLLAAVGQRDLRYGF